MKCLVLGGAGFIGSHLCEALEALENDVTIYDRFTASIDNLRHINSKVKLVSGDFSQEKNFEQILKDIDVVFHLVSTTLPSNEDTILDVDTNILPTLALLEACKNKSIKVIYFSSGGTVYGIPENTPIPEEHSTDPICSYGIHKLAIEKYLHLYRYLYGLDYAIMRIANPYGERQAPFGSQGAIAVFLAKALLGQPIEIWGDGTIVRDFLYVGDVVNAALLLMEYQGGEKIFNIGSGTGHSLCEIVAEIEEVLGHKIDVKFLQGRKQDVPTNVLDTTRVHQELGWMPTVNLNIGLSKMVAAWCPEKKVFAK